MNACKTVALLAGVLVCASAPAQADGERCAVKHPHAENGGTIVAKMSVINDGTPCAMQMRIGGKPATSLTIRGRPASGVLSSTTASVSYTPNPGFVGKDTFDVQWFGLGFGPNSRSHNVRTKVDVSVRAPSDEPDAMGDEPEAKSAKPGT